MQTKFLLYINDIPYELQDDDLKNWDQIKCTWKRSGLDGIVRSFSSQFEFVNHAYELLLAAYLSDGINTEATIEVQTINNDWTYTTQFSAPLDFTSIQWDDYVLQLNSVDNSLTALINANKNTKYEFTVGEEIETSTPLLYDRMAFRNILKYYLAGGDSKDTGEMVFTVTNQFEKYPAFNYGDSEVFIKNDATYNDQAAESQLEAKPRFFSAWKDMDVDIISGYELYVNKDSVNFKPFADIKLVLYVFDSAKNIKHRYDLASVRECLRRSCGEVKSLPDISNLREGDFAYYRGVAWEVKIISGEKRWVNTKMPAPAYRRSLAGKNLQSLHIHLDAGDSLSLTLRATAKDEYIGTSLQHITCRLTVCSQTFSLSWDARNNPIDVATISPEILVSAICNKITDGKIKVTAHLSDFDARVRNTFILAAESLRNISGAKIYASFNEFAEWMSTVFGYTYYIGELSSNSQFKYRSKIDFCSDYIDVIQIVDEYAVLNDNCQISLIRDAPRGPVCVAWTGVDENDPKRYTKWPGSERYNDLVTNLARTDVLFKSEYHSFYVEDGKVIEIEGDVSDSQDVYFVHRSELFRPNGNIHAITNARKIKYSVDTANIYSDITIGYNKKDFDNINGRNEFNFNNSYTTGCSVKDKSLSLLSKFRADSYGIEITAQERNKDTTDAKSDQDVFFILCTQDEEQLIPDRSANVKLSLVDSVFNAAFSPISCIKANAGILGMQYNPLTLKFASSTGNNKIIIDGQWMNSDIVLNSPLATCGELEFTTDEVDNLPDMDDIVEVESAGVTYRGYIKELELRFGRTEAAKYKLIVKEIIS